MTKPTTITGRLWVLTTLEGALYDDVDTDMIFHNRYLHITDVKPVREVTGLRIDSIFLGSCTNGRFEDFAAVAEVVRGKRIAPHVMATVVPATRTVYERMLRTGVLETLFEAGFIISNPGCDGCASGHLGMTGKGQVNLSTSNHNFPGKQGRGDTYLVSPVMAAWSALRGEVTVPD